MNAINPKYVEALLQMVNTAAFPSHIAFRLAAIDHDSCRVELDILPQHFQPFGIVHGGVLATLIDTATFWAGFMRLPQDAGLVNVDLKLNYLKPAVSGKLVAEGRCLRPGRQISYTEAYVRDEAGELLAHGTSTLMVLPGKGLKIDAPKFLD
ncbi:MAG TPA: PaaI family thioesterase [Solimonas sp.]|nr:PaaI family thioesterase [Solimonas sp.]